MADGTPHGLYTFLPKRNLHPHELAFRQVLARIPAEGVVPIVIFLVLERAYHEGSQAAFDKIIELIISKRCPLSKPAQLSYLKLVAQNNQKAAYLIALASIGQGPLAHPNSKDVNGWKYFWFAAKLGHPYAYLDMLSAICKKQLIITPQEFAAVSHNIVDVTEDCLVALIYGGLLCGIAPTNKAELTSIGLVKNTEEGLEYLVAAYQEGNEKCRRKAEALIVHVLDVDKAQGKFADEIRSHRKPVKKEEPAPSLSSSPPSSPSRSCRLM